MRRTGLVLALCCAAACASGPPRPPRSDGERLYLAKCTSCHRAWEPSALTPAKWEKAVSRMEAEKKVRLDPGERALILGYLTGRESR